MRFKNAARPAVVLESPNPIKADTRQALRKDWEAMHTGLENSHKTAILDNGLKLSRMAFTADEMQEVANAELTIRDVSNFLHIPASKLGDAGAVKYKSKEDDDQSYLGDGLDYWFFAVEDEARDKLFSLKQKQKETHCVLFDRKSLIRADLAAKTAYWTKALGGMPWAIANEARADFDLEPRDEPEANKLQPPLNMGQGGEKNVPKNPADRVAAYSDVPPAIPVRAIDPDGANDAAKAMIADTCRRVVTRLGGKGQRAAGKPAEYLAWLDALAVDDATRAAFAPAEQLVTSIRGVCPDLAGAALIALRSSLEATPTATAAQLSAAVETSLASAQETVGAAVIAKLWSVP